MTLGALGRLVAAAALTACASAGIAAQTETPETVTIFSAGSLRGVVAELAAQVGLVYHIRIEPTFGGSGALRERIEHGTHADLLLSADVGSPRKLEGEGRTVVPALAFARNRICIVAPRSEGVTTDNLVDRMLAPGTRTWTSTPVVDPGGDYAAAIFDKINALHPGAGASLKARAKAVRDATAREAPGPNHFATLFAEHRIDLLVTYCSGVPKLEQQDPALASLRIPPGLDPHPSMAWRCCRISPRCCASRCT
ncbi:MAG: substrate-binding domain-containing protein [Rhodanobacteraceae bacterium]